MATLQCCYNAKKSFNRHLYNRIMYLRIFKYTLETINMQKVRNKLFLKRYPSLAAFEDTF